MVYHNVEVQLWSDPSKGVNWGTPPEKGGIHPENGLFGITVVFLEMRLLVFCKVPQLDGFFIL